MTQNALLSPFEDVLSDFRAGKMVIICDDADRENEGDLALATDVVTPDAVAFMVREARGLVCVTISEEVAARLNLPLQVLNNNSPFQTPFTISIDHREVSAEGVTATSRAYTMKKLIEETSTAEDFVAPGNVFPLIANPAGVLARQGQTEGSYDLARLAGFSSSGIICEILNPDGTMARGDSLAAFARQHNLKVTSVREILRYRIRGEVVVRNTAESLLDTEYGKFRTFVFRDDVDGREHLALTYGDLRKPLLGKGPLVRIHSECLTGDVFGSLRCDCGDQLSLAMREIVREGAGILLYLRQEGRGIGLGNKIRAYELQDQGHDTVDANLKLGFPADQRDFAVAANILEFFGVNKVRLLTNNPQKLDTLVRCGIEISERIPVLVAPTSHSQGYLDAKREKLGHLL